MPFLRPETVELIGGPFDGKTVPFQDGYCINLIVPQPVRLSFVPDDVLSTWEYAEYTYDVIGQGKAATVKTATFRAIHHGA